MSRRDRGRIAASLRLVSALRLAAPSLARNSDLRPRRSRAPSLAGNQFGGQAPGSDAEEREAAYAKVGVRTFPVLDHVEVNGAGAVPLYRALKAALPGDGRPTPFNERGAVAWNYTFFLVGRDGAPAARYEPGADPLDFEGDGEFSCVLGGPVEAENILETNQPINQPTNQPTTH